MAGPIRILVVEDEDLFVDFIGRFSPKRNSLQFVAGLSEAREQCVAEKPGLLVVPVDCPSQELDLLLQEARRGHTRILGLGEGVSELPLVDRVESPSDVDRVAKVAADLLEERREWPRLDNEVELEVEGLGPVVAQELSSNSLFIPTETQLETGTRLPVQIRMAEEILTGTATVTRSGRGADGTTGVVLTFPDGSDPLRVFLEHKARGILLQEHLAERRTSDEAAQVAPLVGRQSEAFRITLLLEQQIAEHRAQIEQLFQQVRQTPEALLETRQLLEAQEQALDGIRGELAALVEDKRLQHALSQIWERIEAQEAGLSGRREELAALAEEIRLQTARSQAETASREALAATCQQLNQRLESQAESLSNLYERLAVLAEDDQLQQALAETQKEHEDLLRKVEVSFSRTASQTALAATREQLTESRAAWSQTRAELEQQLASQAEAVAGLGKRLAALAEDPYLRQQLAQTREQLDRLGQQGVAQADAVTQLRKELVALAEKTRHELARREATTQERLSQTRAELEQLLASQAEAVAGQGEKLSALVEDTHLRQQLERLEQQLGEQGVAQEDALSQLRGELVALVDDTRHGQAEREVTTHEQLERLEQQLGELGVAQGDALSQLRGELVALGEETRHELARREVTTHEQLSETRAELEQQLASQAEVVVGLGEKLSALAEDTDPRQELAQTREQLEQQLEASSAALSETREQLERLEQQLGEQGVAQEDALSRLRGELVALAERTQHELARREASTQEQLSSTQEAQTSLLRQLEQQLEASSAALSGTRAELEQQLASQAEAVVGLGEKLSALAEDAHPRQELAQTREQLERLEQQLGEQGVAQEDALSQLRGELVALVDDAQQGQAERAVSTQEQLDRLEHQLGELGVAQGDALSQLRAELLALVEDARQGQAEREASTHEQLSKTREAQTSLLRRLEQQLEATGAALSKTRAELEHQLASQAEAMVGLGEKLSELAEDTHLRQELAETQEQLERLEQQLGEQGVAQGDALSQLGAELLALVEETRHGQAERAVTTQEQLDRLEQLLGERDVAQGDALSQLRADLLALVEETRHGQAERAVTTQEQLDRLEQQLGQQGVAQEDALSQLRGELLALVDDARQGQAEREVTTQDQLSKTRAELEQQLASQAEAMVGLGEKLSGLAEDTHLRQELAETRDLLEQQLGEQGVAQGDALSQLRADLLALVDDTRQGQAERAVTTQEQLDRLEHQLGQQGVAQGDALSQLRGELLALVDDARQGQAEREATTQEQLSKTRAELEHQLTSQAEAMVGLGEKLSVLAEDTHLRQELAETRDLLDRLEQQDVAQGDALSQLRGELVALVDDAVHGQAERAVTTQEQLDRLEHQLGQQGVLQGDALSQLRAELLALVEDARHGEAERVVATHEQLDRLAEQTAEHTKVLVNVVKRLDRMSDGTGETMMQDRGRSQEETNPDGTSLLQAQIDRQAATIRALQQQNDAQIHREVQREMAAADKARQELQAKVAQQAELISATNEQVRRIVTGELQDQRSSGPPLAELQRRLDMQAQRIASLAERVEGHGPPAEARVLPIPSLAAPPAEAEQPIALGRRAGAAALEDIGWDDETPIVQPETLFPGVTAQPQQPDRQEPRAARELPTPAPTLPPEPPRPPEPTLPPEPAVVQTPRVVLTVQSPSLFRRLSWHYLVAGAGLLLVASLVVFFVVMRRSPVQPADESETVAAAARGTDARSYAAPGAPDSAEPQPPRDSQALASREDAQPAGPSEIEQDAGAAPVAVAKKPGRRRDPRRVRRQLVGRARQLLRRRKPRQARRYLTVALKMKDDVQVRSMLAKSHQMSGQLWATVHHLNKAVPAAGLRARSGLQDWAGTVYIRLGKKAAACKAFRAAAASDKRRASARRHLAKHCK